MQEKTKLRILTFLAAMCIMLAIAFGKAEGKARDPMIPPERFQADGFSRVHFTKHAAKYCAIVKAPKGALACANQGWIILPNPCTFGEVSVRGTFAYFSCHELGHNNGWPADHRRD